jgi:hypothetical protein
MTIVAQNNQINQLHPELMDMYCLQSINLTGNPIVNQCPDIARVDNDADRIANALNKYFSGGGGMGGMGGGMSVGNLGAFQDPPKAQPAPSKPSTFQSNPYGGGGLQKQSTGGSAVKVSQLLQQANSNPSSNPKLQYQPDS